MQAGHPTADLAGVIGYSHGRRQHLCIVLYLYIRVTLKPMKKLKFILFEVVPSEVVTPTKYINSVKFQNFMLMFTGGST